LGLLEEYLKTFHAARKLAIIAARGPAYSAVCERTFSCLRRLKTYLRNNMTDKRLYNLDLPASEK
jgi:hypothetical protein